MYQKYLKRPTDKYCVPRAQKSTFLCIIDFIFGQWNKITTQKLSNGYGRENFWECAFAFALAFLHGNQQTQIRPTSEWAWIYWAIHCAKYFFVYTMPAEQNRLYHRHLSERQWLWSVCLSSFNMELWQMYWILLSLWWKFPYRSRHFFRYSNLSNVSKPSYTHQL